MTKNGKRAKMVYHAKVHLSFTVHNGGITMFPFLAIDVMGGLTPPQKQEWWVGMGFPILILLLFVIFIVVALILLYKMSKK